MNWTLRDTPERIVCLTEEFTEILYELGEDERIVGISAYTERPPEAVEDKPVVSAFIGGSIDKIQDLEPDLILGFSDIQAELAAELIQAGEQVAIFNQRTIQDILDVVYTVGRLVGAGDRAAELVDGYIERLAQMRERSENNDYRRPRVYFEEWPDPRITCIRWVSQLIEIAGGKPVFPELAKQKGAEGRTIEPGDVIDKEPDIIMASWCGKPVDIESIRSRDNYNDLPAVRDDEIHEIDPAIILQPGPACLTDGLARVSDIISSWRGK